MLFKIIPTDIDLNKRCKSGYCPIATCVKRTLSQEGTVDVAVWPERVKGGGWKWLIHIKGDFNLKMELPRRVGEAAANFDCHGEMDLIKFELPNEAFNIV